VAVTGITLANGVAFGIAYTFGTFFKAMATDFGVGSGSTALIFGVTLLFFFGGGIFAGPFADRLGDARPLLVLGGAMLVAGLLATSAADRLWVGVLSYGVGVGVGGGLFVAPLTAMVGRIFVRRRAAAMAFIATGNGLGTLIFSPLSESIIDADGWRRAYVVLAVIAAVVLTASTVMLMGYPPTADGTTADSVSALSTVRRFVGDRRALAMWGAGVLMSIGLFIAFTFIVPFAVEAGVTSAGASRLVGVVGLSSIAGRVGLMVVAGRLGPVRLMQLTLAVQPIAYAVWLIAGSRYVLLVMFAVMLGIAYGGFVAVAPEALLHLVGMSGAGMSIGLLFLSFGVGGLIGPPAAGYLADAVNSTSTVIGVVIGIVLLGGLVSLAMTGPPAPESGA